nr:DUF2871 domain-containing protein [uncultured Corynebacterium sp.]
MRKLFTAAAVYVVLGLAACLFYRSFTVATDHFEPTQLNTLHTHLLVLGTFFFLIALALDKVFGFSRQEGFMGWFIAHNVGIVWTTGFMMANGIVHTLSGPEAWSEMWAGMSGLGHIILTVTFAWFFILLNKAMKQTEADA